jgi:hypothetical protein
MRSSSQRSKSGTRRSSNVTGAADEFQHRTGHPPSALRNPETLAQALTQAIRIVMQTAFQAGQVFSPLEVVPSLLGGK